MIAVTTVPHSVERGMLRSGSMTFSAGTVADSSPSSGQRVRIAAASHWPEIVNGCGSTLISEVSGGEQQDREDDRRAAA